jgi:Trypsin-like peptidase domain
LINPDGLVLTNNHVIEDGTKISATVLATGRTHAARVVGYDKSGDIALIQLQGAPALHAARVPAGSGADGCGCHSSPSSGVGCRRRRRASAGGSQEHPGGLTSRSVRAALTAASFRCAGQALSHVLAAPPPAPSCPI